jgi:hypothetical protein
VKRPVPRAKPPKRKRAGQPRKRPGPRGVEYRRVFSVGDSMAVTLAPACLRLLGVPHGGSVQVVPHPSGKVIIAPMRMRLGVAVELVAASREVVHLRQQLMRATARLRALPVRQVAQGFSAGFMKAFSGELVRTRVRLDALTAAVEGLHVVVMGRSAPGLGFPDGVVAVDAPDPDEQPAPAHPLPSGVSCGEAATPGSEAPQVAP